MRILKIGVIDRGEKHGLMMYQPCFWGFWKKLRLLGKMHEWSRAFSIRCHELAICKFIDLIGQVGGISRPKSRIRTDPEPGLTGRERRPTLDEEGKHKTEFVNSRLKNPSMNGGEDR